MYDSVLFLLLLQWDKLQGSRVFESPKTNIWCSPPASTLPTPTALLAQDNKREYFLKTIDFSFCYGDAFVNSPLTAANYTAKTVRKLLIYQMKFYIFSFLLPNAAEM